MRNLKDISKILIDQDSCKALRRFELLFYSKTPIKQLLESQHNLLSFKLEATPKLLRAFTVFMTFPSSTHPNKAGVNWNSNTHPTPEYFSNSGPCHKDSSRDLISRRLFPFFRRVVADHLYSCGYGLDMERHIGEVFKSCRGSYLYQEVSQEKATHRIYKGPKYMGTETEVYPGHCRDEDEWVRYM